MSLISRRQETMMCAEHVKQRKEFLNKPLNSMKESTMLADKKTPEKTLTKQQRED